MAKTSFTIHLDVATANKVARIQEAFPDFSRNKIIRMCIEAFDDSFEGGDFELNKLKRHINALFKQINQDWKRKKNLPFHFADEYTDISNYDLEQMK